MPSARAYALVAAVALATHATSLRNGFVYDDVPAVAQDPRIRTLHPGLLAMPYWREDMRDRIYRPATTLSFAVDWRLGGGAPVVFHATNVVLHVGVVVLLLGLLARVLGPAGAIVGALWFAVHPVHVEAVAGVVGRAELLAAVGYLGAVAAYLAEERAARAAPAGTRRALLALATLAGAALAFGAKEHALTLPLLLALTDVSAAKAARESLAMRARRRVLLWCAVLALAVGYLAARGAVLGTTFGGGSVGAGLEDLTAAGRATVMLPAMLTWFRLVIFPLHLSADYSPDAFVPRLALGATHLAGASLVALAVTGAWASRRAAPAVAVGIVAFAVTALIAANVIVPTGVLLAERVLYLPTAGAGAVAGALFERFAARRAAWPVAAAVLLLLAARSLERTAVWRDEERFYAALQRDAPASYRASWARGARAFERGAAAEGEREYQRAVATWPHDAVLLQEFGERYLAAGLWAPADRYLTWAWTADSARADAALQAVIARTRLGRADEAVALGANALRRFPAAPNLLLATAGAYRVAGLPRRALALERRAALSAPRSWQYQLVAAAGALDLGLCEDARRRAERARALAPAEVEPRQLLDRLDRDARCRRGDR